VDGIRGERFVLREEVGMLDDAERDASTAAEADTPDWAPLDPGRAGVALLAPLDPFVWDRDLLRSLFDFDYIWEVYVPEAKRRWGYYVLPILWGDRLVGRLEPRIDRAGDAVDIRGVWWQAGFEPLAHPDFVGQLAAALEAHRAFAGVRRIRFDTTVRPAAIRPRDLGVRAALQEHLPSLGPARRRRVPGGHARRALVGR